MRLVVDAIEHAGRRRWHGDEGTPRQRFGLRADILEYKPTTGGSTETAGDSAIVAASLAACVAHGVSEPGPFGFQGACDLVHFRSLGAEGTVIGPGSLSDAHKPNEFVPLDEFVAASLIYRDIAKSMLPVSTQQT